MAKRKGKHRVKPLKIRVADGSVAGCYDPSGVRRPIPPNRCEECAKHSDLVCPPRRELREIEVDLIDSPMLEVEKIREDIDNISASLKAVGEPYFSLYVRPKENGRYELIHHRSLLEAARRAGLKKIWAEVLYYDSKTTILAILSTSPSLKPLEEAKGIEILIKDFKATVDEIAVKTGKGVEWVEKRLTLSQASEAVKEALRMGLLTPEEAFEISQADLDQQDEVIETIKERKLTLDEIRAYVRRSKNQKICKVIDVVLNVVKKHLPISELKAEWLPGLIKRIENVGVLEAEVDLQTKTIKLYPPTLTVDKICELITHEAVEYIVKKYDAAVNTFFNKLVDQKIIREKDFPLIREQIDRFNEAIYLDREADVKALMAPLLPIVKAEVEQILKQNPELTRPSG